jgi:hypothetical protein
MAFTHISDYLQSLSPAVPAALIDFLFPSCFLLFFSVDLSGSKGRLVYFSNLHVVGVFVVLFPCQGLVTFQKQHFALKTHKQSHCYLCQ